MKKKFVATGLLAGLLAGTGAGLIIEQTGFAGASNIPAAAVVGDDTGTTVAANGTTSDGTTSDGTDGLRPDRTARLTEVLQPLVDDGTITADQLTKVVSALDAAGPMGGGHGPGGDHMPGGPGGRGHGLEIAATALGITADELHTALDAGQTIADVASSKGVAVQTVIDAMVAEATTHLAERVTAGDLTQAEADAKLTEITARITDMVNNGRPAGGPDAPAPDAAAPAADTTATTAG
jgi:hypothetical protein